MYLSQRGKNLTAFGYPINPEVCIKRFYKGLDKNIINKTTNKSMSISKSKAFGNKRARKNRRVMAVNRTIFTKRVK